MLWIYLSKYWQHKSKDAGYVLAHLPQCPHTTSPPAGSGPTFSTITPQSPTHLPNSIIIHFIAFYRGSTTITSIFPHGTPPPAPRGEPTGPHFLSGPGNPQRSENLAGDSRF